MTKQMTLEQVRDILREAGRYDIYGTDKQACDLADAIDAHLNAAKGEAVAWWVVADTDIWEYLEPEDREIIYTDERYLPSKEELDGWQVTPLYTHPASPDVVRDA